MAREVFIIQNVSTNRIELQDFGVIIPPDVSLDLANFDRAYLSSEVDGYLLSGDILRLIDGASVGYNDAYISQISGNLSASSAGKNISIDTSSLSTIINVVDNIEDIKSITFDTSIGYADTSHGEGVLHWHPDVNFLTYGTVKENVHISIGRDSMFYAINLSSSDIPKGRAVQIVDASGSIPSVSLVNGTSNFASVSGLSTTDISIGEYGYVQFAGKIHNINTEDWGEGDILRLDATLGGYLTDSTPDAPNPITFIGTVTKSDASDGEILLTIDNGPRLSFLPDVNARFSATDNNVLIYDGTNKYWDNIDFGTAIANNGGALGSSVNAYNAIQDASILTLESSVGYLFDNQSYSETYIDSSFNQAYSDLTLTAGLNMDITNQVVSTIEDPSFNSATIVTDLSLGGNFLFDYENVYTVAKSGSKYSTVNEALEVASDNDVIMIMPGTYVEDISINKVVALYARSAAKSIIQGKVTITQATGTVEIKGVGLHNTNDVVLEINHSDDTAKSFIHNCNLNVTYDNGTGQTANTAKAIVKILKGYIDVFNGEYIINANGDNIVDHNTTVFWIDGNERVELVSDAADIFVSNVLDPNQNLSIVFNTNINPQTNIEVKTGNFSLTGIQTANNHIFPFYNKDASINFMIGSDTIIKAYDSGSFCLAHNVNSRVRSVYQGDSVTPENITTVNVACTDASSSQISVLSSYYAIPGRPQAEGDVIYFINNSAGFTYTTSGLVIGDIFNLTELNLTEPSTGDLWFNGTNLLFQKDASTTEALTSGGINIGSGEGVYAGKNSDYDDLFRTIDGSNGLYTYTDGSTVFVDSSIYVPGSYTYTGQSHDGPLTYHIPRLYANSKWVGERTANVTAFSSASGVTQVSPYDVSAELYGNFYPWGTSSWDASGNSSLLTLTDWIIFYQEIGENVKSSWVLDASNLSNGPWTVYADYNNGTPILVTENFIDREPYPERCYLGHIGVNNGKIKIWHESPDLFGTSPTKRSSDSYGLKNDERNGIDVYVVDASTVGITSGHYYLEGASFRDVDFYNGVYTGEQNANYISAVAPALISEVNPSTGYTDPTKPPRQDLRTYSNTYYDTNTGTYVDSSANGKYVLSAAYLIDDGRFLISRGGIYDSISDATADIANFGSTSTELNTITTLLHPKLAYIIMQTDISTLEDPEQFQLLKTATTSVAGGGGGGTGGVAGAQNIGLGTGLYKDLVASLLQFKSLATNGSDIVISQDSNTVYIDASLKDYDPSINDLYSITDDLDLSIGNLYDTKVDLAGDTMTGALKVPNVNITSDLSIGGNTYHQNIALGAATDNILAINTSGQVVNTAVPLSSITAQQIFDVTTSLDVSILRGIYYVNATLGNITIRVPDATASNDGSQLRVIKKAGTFNVIVTTVSGLQNIGSSASQTISQIDKGFSIVADNDNSKWLIVQDSRFLEGTVDGEFQYWNSADDKWEGAGESITWEPNDRIFSVGAATPATFAVDVSNDIIYISSTPLSGLVPADNLDFYAGGRGAFGNSVTMDRLRANAPGSVPRSLSLIDTNSVLRIWRWAGTGADPAVEFVWGTAETPADGANAWWDMYLDGDTPPNDLFAIRRRTGGTTDIKLSATPTKIDIPMTTTSTSTTTGALTVAGGVGVAGALRSATLNTTGDAAVGGSLRVSNVTPISAVSSPNAQIDTANGNKVVTKGGYYGQEFQLATSLAASTTSATTPQTKVTMTTTNLPAGTYKITAGWVHRHTSASNDAIFDLTINGTPQGTQSSTNMEAKDTNSHWPSVRVYYVTLSGVNTILLRYWNESSSTTISDATIELIRVS